jgi:CheY-specific phosphatase CheX
MITIESILVDAVRQVFGTMLISDAIPDESGDLGAGQEALGMVQIFDGDARGSIAVGGRPEAVAAIYERLLGTPISFEAETELRDALGEVLNMVGGICKARFLAQGLKITLSLPFDVHALARRHVAEPGSMQYTLVGFDLKGLEQRLVFRFIMEH